MQKTMTTQKSVNRFFKAWQKEFPNFYTPKLKKVLQKKDYVVSVSAGQGAYDKYPVYDTTAFKMFHGRMKGVYRPRGVSVKGFKRLKGKRFTEEVKARAYAKKLLRGL